MEIGIALPLPQDDLGADPILLRDFVQAAEQAGFDHISAYDHVVGTDPAAVSHLPVRYTHESLFHEPLVFLAWAAAQTTRIGLVSAVLVAPQRQVALLAKQVAELDVLSGGRVRHLGLGVGSNSFEYEALGVPFAERGRILDEQIDTLRLLWDQDVVTSRGRGFTITSSGINPRPARGRLPLWLGGSSARALDRAVARADGHVLMTSDPQPALTIQRICEQLRAAGRDSSDFGFQGFLDCVTGTADEWAARARRAREAGVTRATVMTAHPALGPAATVDHVARLGEVAAALLVKTSGP